MDITTSFCVSLITKDDGVNSVIQLVERQLHRMEDCHGKDLTELSSKVTGDVLYCIREILDCMLNDGNCNWGRFLIGVAFIRRLTDSPEAGIILAEKFGPWINANGGIELLCKEKNARTIGTRIKEVFTAFLNAWRFM